jgi:dTDP-4-dehydrorhamnose reductase
MRQRLFIVGATGFVGSRLSLAACDRFTVVGGSRHPDSESGQAAIDITDRHSVSRAFDQARPELVVHLAALSDIDRCERERELAEQINVVGAMHVAGECARRGARLLYTSTDAVFDGTQHIYYEHDPPTPVNWYGQTKARAEQAIVDILPSSAIVRLSLVLGRSALPGGNSYLENATGIFQIGASDKMSRYDLARAIAERLGHEARLIVPQNEPVSGRAPRGRDDFLVTDRVRQFCRTPVPTCREVIERACHGVA